MSELLPCPFCKSTCKPNDHAWVIEHEPNCFLSNHCYNENRTFVHEHDIARWNTRRATEGLRAELLTAQELISAYRYAVEFYPEDNGYRALKLLNHTSAGKNDIIAQLRAELAAIKSANTNAEQDFETWDAAEAKKKIAADADMWPYSKTARLSAWMAAHEFYGAQLAAAKEDSALLDWLEKHHYSYYRSHTGRYEFSILQFIPDGGNRLRAAIDAAMSAQTKEGK